MNLQPTFRSLETYTQEQFARWLEWSPPNDVHHYELLDGFIVREPPAGWPHSEVAIEIGARLRAHVRRRRLGRVFESSQGFDLATGDTVEPDVSFVSNLRWGTLSKPIRGFLKVAPNLVFEIASPSTRRLDRREKKRIYERNDVEEYVLVDPISRTLEQFQLVDGSYGPARPFAVGNTYRSRLLPDFTMVVAALFPEE